ncbi:MAG: aspartate/glutamate racemase family protein [Candidatus Hatepunaea meridiana]|nr:aspartate/glutamate racemase family protein [Candidatus Hatepunaea meridiana]
MKTIGLLGGMSWKSTMEYYRIINETVNEQLGGLHSAEILIYSVDFHDIERLQSSGDWDRLTEMMIAGAKRLQNAGADFLVIGTNTMHLMADDVERNISIPLLHIADATAEEIKRHNIKRVGLLGTRFTMEKDFYSGRLHKKFGLDVLIPSSEDREIVDRIIYIELCQGIVKDASRQEYYRIINNLTAQGAQGIILGCTEIGMLVEQADIDIPLFDTTEIHARKAVDWALKK